MLESDPPFFQIRVVDRRQAQEMEPLGSKPKFWFRVGNQRLLFKADDRGTGEDWAEVVACSLCRLIGLPHVHYELAMEKPSLAPGVVCHNMVPPPKQLILGNQLLCVRDPKYPTSQKFRVKQHTVDAVCEILKSLMPPAREWSDSTPLEVDSAAGVFAGYVMFDAWIANQDRHHENWGGIWSGADSLDLTLAPTFDHGAGMARNLLDSERQDRLTTAIQNRKISAFSKKARSALFNTADDSKPLLLTEAFKKFLNRYPRETTIWLERLQAVTDQEVSDIIQKVPSQRMSNVCKRFTLELLKTNRQRLLELMKT